MPIGTPTAGPITALRFFWAGVDDGVPVAKIGMAVVALDITVLEPLMEVTTLVMMLTLGEVCEEEELESPVEDELVVPPELLLLKEL